MIFVVRAYLLSTLIENNAKKHTVGSLIRFPSVSGVVHTGVEVHKMNPEICGLVEQPWLCYN